MEPKLIFVPGKQPLTLLAQMQYETGPVTTSRSFTGLREHHVDPVGQWCRENHCGRRSSFHLFEFDTRQQMTAFLLRWS